MATKKALLIGINYVGSRAALKGCHNDIGTALIAAELCFAHVLAQTRLSP